MLDNGDCACYGIKKVAAKEDDENMIKDKERLLWSSEFEKDGAPKVEIDLATGKYGNPEDPTYKKAVFAKIWLQRKKSEKEEFVKDRELAIANSAKRASWWALILSGISIIVSIVAIIKK